MVISVAVVVGSLRHDLIVIPVKDQCLYVEGFQILGEVSFRESLDAEIGSRHSSKVARFVCVVTLTMGKRFTGTDASASLRGLDVAGGDLAFVGGEGGQDFGPLNRPTGQRRAAGLFEFPKRRVKVGQRHTERDGDLWQVLRPLCCSV